MCDHPFLKKLAADPEFMKILWWVNGVCGFVAVIAFLGTINNDYRQYKKDGDWQKFVKSLIIMILSMGLTIAVAAIIGVIIF